MTDARRLKFSLLVCALAGVLFGRDVHLWQFYAPSPYLVPGTYGSGQYNLLTKNSGSHAVGLTEYDNASKTWLSIVSERTNSSGIGLGGWAYEWQNWGFLSSPNGWTWSQATTYPCPFEINLNNGTYRPRNVEVAINPSLKLWGGVFQDDGFSGGGNPNTGAHIQGVSDQGQSNWKNCRQGSNDHNLDTMCSFAVYGATNGCVAYTDYYYNGDPDESGYTILSQHEVTGSSGSWDDTRGRPCPWEPIGGNQWRFVNPSLAVGTDAKLHLMFDDNNGGIVYRKSTNWGADWVALEGEDPLATEDGGDVSEPCVATCAYGDDAFVFGCYVRDGERIEYRFSTDGGNSWIPDGSSRTVPLPVNHTDKYDRPNVSALALFNASCPTVLLVVRCKFWDGSAWKWTIRGICGQRWGNGQDLVWFQEPMINTSQSYSGGDEPLNPSVASVLFTHGACLNGNACYVVSEPWSQGRTLNYNSGVYGNWGDNHFWESPFATSAANTARTLAVDANGGGHYASVEGPYWQAGEVLDRSPMYLGAGIGESPALALDGDGKRWVAYIDRDSLFCLCGDEYIPRVVYRGGSAAVPGQPSIACYPGQASGGWVSAIAFCVYDTISGTSRVMFARACSTGVTLDTIESVGSLRDSLPSISIFRSDSLLVTWQHGTDSVLSSLLADYGPGTAGQPPAWSSPSLVTATGYHPMSVMENGSVLNCEWTQKNGSNYAIQRATCDLASAMFGSWTPMASPGSSSSLEKAEGCYAGAGVSVYQQKEASGRWVIKGMMRGDTVTFVANDTDACHPNAVAESSAISPSIDQIRCRILYSAGIGIPVDSGLYDTGVTRYVCDSFNVSHAGSDATRCNNGTKLVRKNGSDSLFAVYSDADGAVAYAWSAAGDSWRREIMTAGRDYPAIAEDSSGKRWVVTRKPSQTISPSVQEAYYRNGSSWTGPETLYSGTQGATLGPTSLSGSSYTTSGIAYAAFLSTSTGGSQSLILAKFNGSVVSTYTVATGSSLGDPTATVEPYKADSDHIHVTWADNGTIKYRMDTDGRSTSIASNWTSTYDLTGRGVVGQHPSINADHDQIVIAWAQGSPADIHSRKRSTSSAYNNWDAAVNLSNTAQNASDWPTITMGDTVVVAWEETRSAYDHDILACINFGDTLNIADNATVSGYPHVLFYNKASGDTAIPYLHTIWSECPEANYYEVGYNKLNLKHPDGEGQQTASSIPIPVRPALASCMPNPFRNHTQISYALPTAGNVSLQVYDVSGRTVRTLASGFQRAGSYSVSWDARDSRGKQVPYGVYFYRLDTPGFRAVKKAVVAR